MQSLHSVEVADVDSVPVILYICNSCDVSVRYIFIYEHINDSKLTICCIYIWFWEVLYPAALLFALLFPLLLSNLCRSS